jgi:3-dehydroquinate synthetase
MVWAARLSVATKTTRGDLEAVVQSALRTLELPWDIDDKSLPSVKALIDAAKSDKKSNGTEVRFVLLRKVGDFVIEPLPWTMITQLLSV